MNVGQRVRGLRASFYGFSKCIAITIMIAVIAGAYSVSSSAAPQRKIRVEPKLLWLQYPSCDDGTSGAYDSPQEAYAAFVACHAAAQAANPLNSYYTPINQYPTPTGPWWNGIPVEYTSDVHHVQISPPKEWTQTGGFYVGATRVCPDGWGTPMVTLGDGYYSVWCEKSITQADPPKDKCEKEPAEKTCEGSYKAGNPIYPESGLKIQEEVDYVSANGLLKFIRTYRSDTGQFSSAATSLIRDMTQGAGIAEDCIPMTYEHSQKTGVHCFRYLTPPTGVLSGQNANAVFVLQEDGRLIPYDQTSGVPVPDENVNGKLIKRSDTQGVVTWLLLRGDGTFEIYSEGGKLLSSTTADGKAITYSYTNGRLTSIADPFGRSLQLEYSGLGLARLIDPAGQYYDYLYSSGGEVCPGPICGKLSGVVYPDLFERSYHWNELAHTANVNLPEALTGVSEIYPATPTSPSRTVRVGTYTYDSGGRVMSTEGALGLNKHQVTSRTIWNGTAVVSDPLNTSRTYKWTQLFNTTYRTSVDQPAGSGSSAAQSKITYDANANVASRNNFNGRRTCYSNDLARNTELVRVEGLSGTSSCSSYTGANVALPTGSRKISTQWHPDLRLFVKRAEPARITTRVYNGQPDPFNGGATASCAPGSALLPDGKPIAVVCREVEQATTDTQGRYGFTATLEPGVPNRERSWTYNEYGQVLTEDGPRTDVSDVTSYAYYSSTTSDYTRGDLSQIIDSLSRTTYFTHYNPHGQLLRSVDPNGLITSYTYDLRQRLTSSTVGGLTTTYDYDPSGQLTRVTLPDSSYLGFEYDDAHRIVAMYDDEGNRIAYTLDAAGNRTKIDISDPSSSLVQTQSLVYDALGRQSQQIAAAGTAAVTTTYGYDGNGNPTTTAAPLGRSWANVYDELSRLKQTTDPATGVTAYTYNGQDLVASVTDPRSKVTSYTYNGLGDLTQQVSPDTGTTTSTYDSAGNLKTKTDARSKTVTYSYDALNRVTQAVWSDQTIGYGYDAGTYGLGRLTSVSDNSGQTSWTYDQQGRVTARQQTMGSIVKQVGYGYNAYGQLSTLTFPSGHYVQLGYTNGKVTSLSLDGSTTILNDVLYEPFGPVSGWDWGNSTLAVRGFDLDGKVEYIDSAGLNNYSYDDAFRITGITDATDSTLSQSLGYDLLDRLTSATGTSLNQSWTYDANGNRLTQGGSTSTTFTLSTSNNRLLSTSGALTRTYAYDAAGNTTDEGTATFTYDDAGRMVSATKAGLTTTYSLNALGQRVKKSNSILTTYFVYDEQGHLLGEYDGSGNLVQEIVWLGDTPVASLRYDETGANVGLFYIHTDHLNTPRKMTRPSDNAIVWRWDSDPFGTSAPNEDPDGNSLAVRQNLRFPGQYWDEEKGSAYNFYRDCYDPATGRYCQPDPIGLAGGINPYVYVENNPISNVDPFGLAPKIKLPKLPSRPKLTKDQCKMDCQALYQSLIRACQATGAYFFACKAEIDQLIVECMVNGKPPAPECQDRPQMCEQKEDSEEKP